MVDSMVPVRLFVAATLSAHAFAPPRPHATLRRVARPAVIAGPPERWSWSGPVVPPAAPALAETKGAQKRLVFLLAISLPPAGLFPGATILGVGRKRGQRCWLPTGCSGSLLSCRSS